MATNDLTAQKKADLPRGTHITPGTRAEPRGAPWGLSFLPDSNKTTRGRARYELGPELITANLNYSSNVRLARDCGSAAHLNF